MAPKTTRVENGKITLPKELKKTWEKAEVFMDVSGDTILIKRLSKPSLTLKGMINEFRKIGKNISKKDVKEAIEWARREEKQT